MVYQCTNLTDILNGNFKDEKNLAIELENVFNSDILITPTTMAAKYTPKIIHKPSNAKMELEELFFKRPATTINSFGKNSLLTKNNFYSPRIESKTQTKMSFSPQNTQNGFELTGKEIFRCRYSK